MYAIARCILAVSSVGFFINISFIDSVNDEINLFNDFYNLVHTNFLVDITLPTC